MKAKTGAHSERMAQYARAATFVLRERMQRWKINFRATHNIIISTLDEISSVRKIVIAFGAIVNQIQNSGLPQEFH
jgi:hypothetical protein